jgi:SAM-dependent methyltransferase
MPVNEMIPSTLPTYAKQADFIKTGKSFLRSSISLGDLQPDEHVLDLGCGVGRFAVALTEFIRANGSYDGVDVARESIQWCVDAITPRYPNFQFHLLDAYNGRYNASGTGMAAEVVFPFEDGTFDFVFANSLFTHLLEDDVKNYAHEIARVTKPGGRMLVTIFLLDDEATALVRAGRGKWAVPHRVGVAHVEKKNRPESVVAYDEPFVRSLFESCGFELRILHGAWSGRGDHNN